MSALKAAVIVIKASGFAEFAGIAGFQMSSPAAPAVIYRYS